MKKLYLLFLLLYSFSFLQSQTNLIPNGSFEQHTSCPDAAFSGDLSGLTNWWVSSQTPDYFNACAPYNSCMSVPYNGCGFQQPYDGNAYIGIFTIASDFVGDATYRECATAKLTTTLTIGTEYFFSMQVSPTTNFTLMYDSVGSGCNQAQSATTNKIGALFTTNKYDNMHTIPINNFAHIYATNIITDSANWTRVSGSFIADSAYQYINLGNFFDDAHTDTFYIAHYSGNYYACLAYYYIDSVSLYANNATGIDNAVHQENIVVFPNPIPSNYFFIKSFYLIQSIFIYNQLGQPISFKINSLDNGISKIVFDEEPEKGVYILELISQQKTYHYSLIKN